MPDREIFALRKVPMRTFFMVVLTLALTFGFVNAAEKQSFINGVVSVVVPDNWNAELDQRQLALSIIRDGEPSTRIIFSTPGLNSEGDPSVPFERNLDLMYMFFGSDLNIISEESSVDRYGKTGMQMDYSARRDGNGFRGRVFSFAEAGTTVLAIYISKEDDFAAYEESFNAILSSYAVNADALAANRDMFQKISDQADQLYSELVEELDEAYEDEATEQ